MEIRMSIFIVAFLAIPVLSSVLLDEPEIQSMEVAAPRAPSQTVLYKDKEGRRQVEVVYAKLTPEKHEMVDCYIMADIHVSKEFLISLSPERTVVLETKELEQILDECSALLLSHLLEGKLHSFTEGNLTRGTLTRGVFDALLIFPGTKWCGAGNVASNYEDLGMVSDTDMCCRTHDHCYDSIPAGEVKHGLKNKAIHTKSHCSCDKRFESCLKSNRAVVSNTVGSLYFNLLQAQCFERTFPIKKCLEHSGLIPWIYWSCQKYEFDTTKPEIYQFLDAKKY